MSARPHRRNPIDDEEDESLFGSPPPSPGRSPSPALALPGTSTAIPNVITKNVGTIALPGSQPHSELLNPLASTLSLPHTRIPPLPSSVVSSDSSLPPTPSIPPAALPKPPRARKRKKRVTPASTPRPELQIPLPDPGVPPPANFLRSQTALLGAAGLVAGINPATLVHRARGTTPSNPIVIEEDLERKPVYPLMMNQPPLSGPAAVEAILNKPGLAMPSKQEILAQLVKEKDIFPIIKSLIKLTAPTANASDSSTSGSPQPEPVSSLPPTPSTWGAEQYFEEAGKGGKRTKVVGTHATGYPMKKRKLNRVPAGAADWDAPFPFDRGEGPQEYRENWRSERGKQLVAQLLNLIQSATKKAAMIKYLKRRGRQESKLGKGKPRAGAGLARTSWDEPKVNKYYKAVTATYGLSPSDASSRQSTPAADSNSRSVTPSTTSAPPSSSAATTPAPEHSQQSDSLDQLLSSIFAMSNTSQLVQSSSAASLPAAGGSGDPFGVDQSWLDDWMRSLNTTSPMDLDGLDGLHSMDSSGNAQPMDFDFSSFDLPTPMNLDQSFDIPPSLDTFPIDPELLALGPLPASDGTGSAPLTSTSTSTTSSLLPTAGTTPASAEWDLSSMMDLFGPGFAAGGSIPISSSGLDMTRTDSVQGGLNDPMWDAITGKVDMVSEGGGMGERMAEFLLNQPEPPVSMDMPVEMVQQVSKPFDPPPPVQSLPVQAVEIAPEAPLQECSITKSLPPSVSVEVPQDSTSAAIDPQESIVPIPVTETISHSSIPPSPLVPTLALIPHIMPPAIPESVATAPPPSEANLVTSLPSSTPPSVVPTPSTTLSTIPDPKTAQPPPKPTIASQKEDLIRRVKERKTLLELELNKVKLQLWETTIEQGALHHVLAHYQEKEKKQKEDVITSISSKPSL